MAKVSELKIKINLDLKPAIKSLLDVSSELLTFAKRLQAIEDAAAPVDRDSGAEGEGYLVDAKSFTLRGKAMQTQSEG